MTRTGITVSLVSSALIAYQLTLMRTLSFIQWYHFAFMIISVAMLGFGTSGVILSVFREKVLEKFNHYFYGSILACSILMILSPQMINFVNFEPYLILIDYGQILSIFYVCGILFLPFVFGAIVIGLSFMYYSKKVHILYFYNLLGSAIGSILGIGFMFLLHPFQVIPIISLIVFLSALPFLKNFTSWYAEKSFVNYLYVLTALNLLIIIATFFYVPINLRMSEYKSLSKIKLISDSKIIKVKISPMGVIYALENSTLRYAPGLSLNYSGEIPVSIGVYNDGEWAGAIFNRVRYTNLEIFDFTTSALPYRFFSGAEVLVLGVGTGMEILLALRQNVNKITGIELNSQIVDLIKKDFVDITADIYNSANVNIISGEARSLLIQLNKKYDVISIPIMEGFTTSAAGMQSLFENYLFTLESFELMYDRLNDSGVLAINTWINYPPRQSLKIISTLIEVLKRKGISDPEQHFAGIRSWNTVTLFIKKKKYTTNEIEIIKKFCEQYSFDPISFPGINSNETNRYNQLEYDYFYNFTQNIFMSKADSVYRDYPFFIKPATDNQPYFLQFLKLGKIPQFLKMLGTEGILLMDWGYLILLSTLIVLLFLSIILLLLPIFFFKKSNMVVSNKFRIFMYFTGIGIGFMFIEIVLIQKFILFLGHPLYSVSAIITGILLFSGLGSYYSKRLNAERNLRIFIGIILILGIFYNFLLDELFGILVHFPVWLKYIMAVFLISPIAFFMGIPFPTGIGILARTNFSLIPWAWGVNGFLSVISTVIAVIVAIEMGFFVVFMLAVLSYFIVLLVGGKLVKIS